MRISTASSVLLSYVVCSLAISPSPTTPQTTPGSGVKTITYWSPITTLPPSEEIYKPVEHLELRQAAVAAAGAGAAAVPAQPAAGAAAGAAAAQPVAPAVGVGGAGAVPAAAQPASVNPDQVSPVTTINVISVVGGVTKQVPFVYSQKFSTVPDQGPTPAKGVIGLGTLTGQIGVVNTADAAKGSASGRQSATFGVMLLGVLGMLALWI